MIGSFFTTCSKVKFVEFHRISRKNMTNFRKGGRIVGDNLNNIINDIPKGVPE